MKYNKLVRDKIPEIMESKGVKAIIHIADSQEYSRKLKEKLLEEVNEYLESETQEEIADILEVIDAIIIDKSFNSDEILNIKNKKSIDRGGFDKRIILDESIE